jgi:hypothetical protein
MLWAVVMVLADAPVDGGFKETAEKIMTETPSAELISMGREAVAKLGTYRYRMAKQERVKGELLDTQEIDAFVRQQPFAVRLHYLAGPGKGRKLLYNSKERMEQFRVREAGFLSIAGALWIGVDSDLAKDDTNHTVKEAGMGALLDRFAADLHKAEGLGGMKAVHEGWDTKGLWCTMYIAPNGGKGFAQARARICTDVASRLPARVESFDAGGAVTERYEFSEVKSAVAPDKFFDSAEF